MMARDDWRDGSIRLLCGMHGRWRVLTHLSAERGEHDARLNRCRHQEMRDDDRRQAAITQDVDKPQPCTERSSRDHGTNADSHAACDESPARMSDPEHEARGEYLANHWPTRPHERIH